MKSKLLLVIVCMFVLSNTAFAASTAEVATFANLGDFSNYTDFAMKNAPAPALWTSSILEKNTYAASCSISSLKKQSVIPLGNCDCSKCRSNQYCCPTANGYCGCFPMPCPR